jgi:hypothetical protein
VISEIIIVDSFFKNVCIHIFTYSERIIRRGLLYKYRLKHMCVLPYVHVGENVRFESLTAALMKIEVLWDMTPCSLVCRNQQIVHALCLYLQ